MALNVRLADSKTAWGRGEEEDAGFDIGDGPYHFMYPEIEELRERSGKYIDQYGDAFFEPHTIKQLLQFLVKAQARARNMKAVESVVIGTDLESGKEYRIDVQKKEITRVLDMLVAAAERAASEGKYLIFIGD